MIKFVILITIFCINSTCAFRIFELDLDATGVHLIQPGTKWCGTGDIAVNDDDLGEFRELDKCCRSHDKCFDSIDAGQTKYGLTNHHVFTMSHCDCDHGLFHCLKTINAGEEEQRTAQSVGNEYFNDFEVQCFNYSSPAMCVKSEERVEQLKSIPLTSRKCTEYAFLPGNKTWQWFDVPYF